MGGRTIKNRRQRLGLTQQQVAAALAVSQQTVARWERTGDVPTKYLKDLAVLLACRVSDLLGDRDVQGGDRVLRTLARDVEDDEQVLYGTARAVFMARASEAPPPGMDSDEVGGPLVREYPIAESEMRRLYSRLQNEDERSTWLVVEALDNRLVFVNRSELERFELIGDDVEAAPTYLHPEVYAALSDPRMHALLEGRASVSDDESAPYSEAMAALCAQVTEEWGGLDAVDDRVSGVMIETVSGRRENLYSDPDSEAYQAVESLLFHIDSIGSERETPTSELLVELGSEGYYRSSFFRLGALRLIEVPLHAFRQALNEEEESMEGREEEEDGSSTAAGEA